MIRIQLRTLFNAIFPPPFKGEFKLFTTELILSVQSVQIEKLTILISL